jgi:hypothetical protein
MATLSPKSIVKSVIRVNLLKTILETSDILYIKGVAKKTVAKQNTSLIKILDRISKSQDKDKTSLAGLLHNQKIVVESQGEKKQEEVSFSSIDKDSRFVTINLGHTFEIVFAASAIAAIKKRPPVNDAASNIIMDMVDEQDVVDVLYDILKETGKLRYLAPGYSMKNKQHDDILELHYDVNSLAYKGLENFISDKTTDLTEYNKKKNKLITPALTYMNSREVNEVRYTLFTNGVVDTYAVTLVGGAQQKPDVKISIKTQGKKTENIRLISLKLNSKSFGVVKGSTQSTMNALFANMGITITLAPGSGLPYIRKAYRTLVTTFNNLPQDEQIKSIQLFLKNFYAGKDVKENSIEVLKFSGGIKNPKVFRRVYEEFSENYLNMFKNKEKLVAKFSKDLLEFQFPDKSTFLQIRVRYVEGGYRHDIEERPGLQKLIGTSPLS